MEMGGINKFFFWFFLIILAFMPYGIIMVFAILLLHYGVPYLKSELKDVCNDEPEENEPMNEFSDDTLERMK